MVAANIGRLLVSIVPRLVAGHGFTAPIVDRGGGEQRSAAPVVQAADNFRNLFETPVLFYALVACAIAVSWVPPWLVIGAWCYFGLRIAHSLIHCTYNRVMHRLAIFALSFGLLVVLWIAYVLALWSKGVL